MGHFFLPPSDATISLSDVTTNDSSTSKHGFLPKLSGVSTQFLNGIGQWVPVVAQEFITGVSVANYAALPPAATNTGLLALVLNNSGIWLINFQSKGVYYSDGVSWNYEGDYVVTSTADHIANTPAGTITATDIQGVANQLDALKEPTANKSTTLVADQGSNVKFPSVKSVYDWVTSSGTWTPIWTGLTIVGTPTYNARWLKIAENLVNVTIVMTSTGSIAAINGATFSQPFNGILPAVGAWYEGYGAGVAGQLISVPGGNNAVIKTGWAAAPLITISYLMRIG